MNDNEPDPIVTVDDLSKAIMNSIDNADGMSETQSFSLAVHVLSFFGYADRIIDNVLEPEDRDAFYMLEDTGILTTEREETTLFDGREWRIHYWLFRRDRIRTLMANPRVTRAAVENDDSVYDELPEDIWHRAEV